MNQTMRTKVLAFLPAVILLAFFAVGYVMGQQTPPLPVSAQEPFDHSQCQYPDRTTNPVDGCDNSDPCDPANVKGGSGDCAPTPVQEPTQTITTPEPVKPAEPEAVRCGK